MSDEKRNAITEALRAAGIEYRAVLTQRGAIQPPDTKDGRPWEHDAWSVAFTRSGKQPLALPYKTGTGHRSKEFGRPNAPHAADVLHSIVCDDTRGASFAEWCADFGYDEDSRRALAVYEQCQKQTDAARRFLGRDLLATIADLLQDYRTTES
jgi:hypothetical protein